MQVKDLLARMLLSSAAKHLLQEMPATTREIIFKNKCCWETSLWCYFFYFLFFAQYQSNCTTCSWHKTFWRITYIYTYPSLTIMNAMVLKVFITALGNLLHRIMKKQPILKLKLTHNIFIENASCCPVLEEFFWGY